jgi:hypothetical protein
MNETCASQTTCSGNGGCWSTLYLASSYCVCQLPFKGPSCDIPCGGSLLLWSLAAGISFFLGALQSMRLSWLERKSSRLKRASLACVVTAQLVACACFFMEPATIGVGGRQLICFLAELAVLLFSFTWSAVVDASSRLLIVKSTAKWAAAVAVVYIVMWGASFAVPFVDAIASLGIGGVIFRQGLKLTRFMEIKGLWVGFSFSGPLNEFN